MEHKKIIAWFSCGATSAVACKLALQDYDDVTPIYIETGSAHPDNKRFIKECEQWYGKKILIIKSDKYKNVDDVLLKTRFINSAFGASCTTHLKIRVRNKYEDTHPYDGQVWGFDFCKSEINRAIRFKEQHPNTKPIYPLIEHKITKVQALYILQKVGIEIPTMYKLGYHNNNCIGCVKGGIGYWNKIRQDFPERFKRMAEIERQIGATCLKNEEGRIFLDELNPTIGEKTEALIPDCGLFCPIEFTDIIDKRVDEIMKGNIKISEI